MRLNPKKISHAGVSVIWGLLALVFVLGSAPLTRADPMALTLSAPDFIIPIGGETGRLDVYADGTYSQSGTFNVLGDQTVYIGAGQTSTGKAVVTLHFPGTGDPAFAASAARIRFTLNDFDLNTDLVTTNVTLNEKAGLRSDDNTILANLKHYLPAGAETDDNTVSLDWIDLMPALDGAYFTDPFVLKLVLSATVTNHGTGGVTLRNTPESLISNVEVTLTPVPEPTSLVLIGVAVSGLGVASLRLRKLGWLPRTY